MSKTGSIVSNRDIDYGGNPKQTGGIKGWTDPSLAGSSREDRTDAGRFAVMVDEIWKNRNNIVWNDTREEATKIGFLAYFNWHDWFLARDGDRVQGPPPPSAWSAPNEGKLKYNVDAGYNNSLGSTKRGWCVRNNVGNFIVAGVAWDYGILPTIVAEAMALKKAI
ncbi:uncharacterized protein LOC131596755 [Vicia villosa]|uniref:uncharacterized protein LOC131596755 n=1 Tax=Vicia villosa TaxID=3911 RepID=UPI00273BA114|nr:uncharacterized protein LOC131596755 [Vicia villosa]